MRLSPALGCSSCGDRLLKRRSGMILHTTAGITGTTAARQQTGSTAITQVDFAALSSPALDFRATITGGACWLRQTLRISIRLSPWRYVLACVALLRSANQGSTKNKRKTRLFYCNHGFSLIAVNLLRYLDHSGTKGWRAANLWSDR